MIDHGTPAIDFVNIRFAVFCGDESAGVEVEDLKFEVLTGAAVDTTSESSED